MAASFGERLRIALSARGRRKQIALAAELNVDASAISRWCNNGTISLTNVVRLCLALDLSMDWLVLGRGDPRLAAFDTLPADFLELVAKLQSYPPQVHAALSDLLRALEDGSRGTG